jgi:hypothetical protein
MSHSESKRRHRGKQHHRRPLRRAALLVGALAIALGCVLLTWAHRDQNEMPRLFGNLYLLAGGLSFLFWGLITAYTRLRGRDTPASRTDRDPSSRSGLALLMALLLMAFLSGVLLHSMMSTHAKLRAGEARRTRLLLRAAALDAAWDSLQTLTGPDQSTVPNQTLENRLPSGIATKVALRPLDRAALPLPLRQVEPPLFGQYLTVAAEAILGNAASMARGMACRLPSGEIRILSWWERP